MVLVRFLRAGANAFNISRSRFYSAKSFPSHTVINMPALSPTMTQGNLGTWHKKIGDEIQPGDVLVEIETDKAQMDFECQDEGFLAKIFVQGGTPDVIVNKPIGVLCDNKDDVAAFAEFSLSDTTAVDSTPPLAQKEEISSAAASSPAKTSSKSIAERVIASPLAKVSAAEKGIELNQVTPSGPGGRIIKVDIDGFKKQQAAPSASAVASTPAPTPSVAGGVAYTDIPVSNIRKVIAQRLTQSKATIPHYYLSVEVKMDKVLKLRQVLNAQANGAYKLSVNDFIVRASALALRDVPEVNASWQDTFIRQFSGSDIAIAVATENGLITPIVKNVEQKGLASISNQIKEMASRAKSGKLAPSEYQGGSFTISNLGMFNIDNFTAIINPPHAGILAVGSVSDKLVLDEGSERGFAVQKICKMSVSCDHRVVDGAVGAQFMGVFAGYLEDPLKMML